MKNRGHHIRDMITITSLVVLFLLLASRGNPVLASEVDLSAALSVNSPGPQSGSPGDFVTFVLELANTGAAAVDLTVSYSNESPWNVIGDSQLTVSAHNRKYFPVTVQIPAIAPANQEKLIQIRFRMAGQSFSLPPVTIRVTVNPLSQIDFTVPAPESGKNNEIVSYPITIHNNGNTTEKINLAATSEHDWPVRLSHPSLELQPDAVQTITVTQQIPADPEADSDKLTITATWSGGQRQLNINTSVISSAAQLAVDHYLWDGQVNAYAPNLTAPSSPLDLSFSLGGQLSPSSSLEINLKDITDSTYRNWFAELDAQPWVAKGGAYNLSYSGLANPAASTGRLYLARQTDDRLLALNVWQSNINQSLYPMALESAWAKQSTWRFLSDPSCGAPRNVLEFSHWNDSNANLRWSDSLAWNLAGPGTLDGGGYAAAASLSQSGQAWNWDVGSQYYHNLNNYLYRFNNWATLYQPASGSRIYSNWQLKTDNYFDTLTHTDLFFQGLIYWPGNYNLRAAYEYQTSDSGPYGDGSPFFSSSFNSRSELYLESRYESRPWRHDVSLGATFEGSQTEADYAAKLKWSAIFQCNQTTALIFYPQLMFFRSPDLRDDFSQISIGARWQRQSGLSCNTWYHWYFNENRQLFEVILSWKLHAYQFDLNYAGDWQVGNAGSNTVSLDITRKFSAAVAKPLATVEGIAFIDRNHNGLFDQGEPGADTLEFLIDGKQPFRTDSNGHYQISGLAPGTYEITVNSRFNVIYRLADIPLQISVKPYQKLTLNIPLIRTQNLVGTVYFDQNQDRQQNEGEAGLAGIAIVVRDSGGNVVQKTFTDENGGFVIYQLVPAEYQLSLDPGTIPENCQIPAGSILLGISPSLMETGASLKLGLIPYEKPIEITTPAQNDLLVSLDKEVVTAGNTLQIRIESSRPLRTLQLILPGNTHVKLKVTPSQTSWTYQWKIPAAIPGGQDKIRCEAVDAQNHSLTAATNVIILKARSI